MAKYTFQIIYKNLNSRKHSVFEESINAESAYEATRDIEKVYPYMEGYTCTLINEE